MIDVILTSTFSSRVCDKNTIEAAELDTDSYSLAFAEEELEQCIQPEVRRHRSVCNQKIGAVAKTPLSVVQNRPKMTTENMVRSEKYHCYNFEQI